MGSPQSHVPGWAHDWSVVDVLAELRFGNDKDAIENAFRSVSADPNETLANIWKNLPGDTLKRVETAFAMYDVQRL